MPDAISTDAWVWRNEMQGDFGHPDGGDGARPFFRDGIWALRLAIKGREHLAIGGRLARTEREALFLLCAPMVPQFRDDARRQRNCAPTITGLWRFEPNTVRCGLLQRQLDP